MGVEKISKKKKKNKIVVVEPTPISKKKIKKTGSLEAVLEQYYSVGKGRNLRFEKGSVSYDGETYLFESMFRGPEHGDISLDDIKSLIKKRGCLRLKTSKGLIAL